MRVTAEPTPRSAPTREAAGSRDDGAALRYAMLSVYYGSLGRQLSSRGAPAMLLPLQVRPLGLRDALDEIASRWPDHLRDAVWRVVRSVPPPRADDADERRYPAALGPVLYRHDPELRLDVLDRLRRRYRAGANLFSAALVASVDGREDEFQGLRSMLEQSPTELSEGARGMIGMTASEFLQTLDDGRIAGRLSRLESEVGLDLYDYIGEFADAVAFLEWWPPDPGAGMTVYPAACVIRQDSSTLVTTVTVTALVSCEDFATLARSTDPQCWECSSDVVVGTRYVRGCYDLAPAPPTPPGRPSPPGRPRLLEEDVAVSWGFDAAQVGSFHNVLRIDAFTADEDAGKIDVDFSLARSIDSRILWDERPGGILVDQGFLKVRAIAPDRWRITSRKVLLFSDRSPNADGPGWLDFGQMLNYLAPAALSWWLESELYSAADQIYSNPRRLQDCLDRHSNGGG